MITASIGSGHNRAAEAIAGQIRSQCPGAEVRIVDFMSKQTSYLNTFVKEGYLKMLNLLPTLYECLYSWTRGGPKESPAKRLTALAMQRDMYREISTYRPDAVICTHPFPCAAAAYLKKRGRADMLLAGVITDFAVHQMWLYEEVDLYFVGNPDMTAELVRRGIAERRIHVTGIPIEIAFNRRYNKEKIIRGLRFEPQRPIVLIMGGGLGLGGVKLALDSLEKLEQRLQIVVVVGQNRRLLTQLDRQAKVSRHEVRVEGFSDRVQEFMAVASLLITKPGALTISEALAMELPMLLSEPIPGQEKENAAYVEKRGAAVWVKDKQQLGSVAAALLESPEKLRIMRLQAQQCKSPLAAVKIAAVIGGYV